MLVQGIGFHEDRLYRRSQSLPWNEMRSPIFRSAHEVRCDRSKAFRRASNGDASHSPASNRAPLALTVACDLEHSARAPTLRHISGFLKEDDPCCVASCVPTGST